MPARGCPGPAMGLLHMGHTQRTSSHFTRHLRAGRRECRFQPGIPRSRPALPAPLTFCGRRAGTAAPPAPPSPENPPGRRRRSAVGGETEAEGGCERVGPARNATAREIPGVSSWELSPVPKPPAGRGILGVASPACPGPAPEHRGCVPRDVPVNPSSIPIQRWPRSPRARSACGHRLSKPPEGEKEGRI